MAIRQLLLAAVAVAVAPAGAAAQVNCESLKDLKLPRANIVSAAVVPEGPVGAGAAGGGAVAPARCVVEGVARPSLDSEIRFEVWMPVTGWNGKYQQVGNGGWAGSIPAASMVEPLRRGYATAGTDDGHRGMDASWAIGHPEKLIDFGHRAVHVTSVHARAIVQAHFGKDPERSYFAGCSDGGREALMEAQRYPEDFDGIVAGAPANDWSHLFTGFVWNEQALLNDPASAIPPEKLAAIQRAALEACDTLDGVQDGLIEDPRACRFDPGVLTCKGGDAAGCLTAAQLSALKKIYDGPKNPRTGASIFPGYPPGTEDAAGGWKAWITPARPAGGFQFFFGNSYYGQAVFERKDWDFKTLDFDKDVEFGNRKAGVILNSTNPDLRSFRARGGKLIQYHGWGDAAISAFSSINYYESVRAFLAAYPDARSDASRPVQDFYRLFMVPGMGHCGGGTGPNRFGNQGTAAKLPADPERDVVAALERWVEKGVAPEKIIGEGKGMTRPLCVYPQVARYKGTGDPNDAANFECAVPAAPR